MYRLGINIDSWHQEMHCKYSKFTKETSYRFTSAVATLPGVCALIEWLNCIVFICLQEVRCCCSGWNNPFRIRHCSKELWLPCVSVFEDHYGGDVAAAIAVVRSRPYGHQLLIKHELVALMDELMRPADQLQIVDVNKLQLGRQLERREGKC